MMKMSAEHVTALTGLITPLDTPAARTRYRTGDIPRADRVRDLDKRYRWDLFYLATAGRWELRNSLAEYLNDSHIDTALRHIVSPLNAN